MIEHLDTALAELRLVLERTDLDRDQRRHAEQARRMLLEAQPACIMYEGSMRTAVCPRCEGNGDVATKRMKRVYRDWKTAPDIEAVRTKCRACDGKRRIEK